MTQSEPRLPAAAEAADPPPTPVGELQGIAAVALFAALIGAGAFVHIPLGPLFVSLQTMFVMLAGFVLGPRRAVLAICLYLACGFIGLPLFGRGLAGPAYFLGPTAGYLPGFAAGAAIAGLSTLVGGGRVRRLAAMLGFGTVAVVVLLAMGAIGLRLTIITDWHRAFLAGFYPFIPGDLVKMAAAAWVKEAFFTPDPGDGETAHA